LEDACDDISVWNNLISWHQHVFRTIKKKFLPLIQQNNGPQGVNGSSTLAIEVTTRLLGLSIGSRTSRGSMLEVCHTSLLRIYTLPNIEISEMFPKLREQARYHYQGTPSQT
jgi:transformation/transcription domain-associated protein